MPAHDIDLFGNPEPAPKGPRVFSVTEVTKAVRGVIESAFDEVWIEGEVSNFRHQASGHQYFTLKDAAAQLSCVLFARGGAWRKTVALQDGMLVQARGKLTVYEARGQYQLTVNLVQAAGAGLLQAKFEALKRKLAAEGLFDAERKRELPQFPRAVGIVTSPTGAALRDMLNVLTRRAPWLRVVVSPARVQGEGAATEIARALDDLNQIAKRGIAPVDVIVLARGGGSIEDLWEFNDEALARAIASSALPVVSAVGHEIDFTIADFVADLRAPTPSAAAELIVPDTAELLRMLAERAAFLNRRTSAAIEHSRTHLAGLLRSSLFREPARRIEEAAQRTDLADQSLQRAVESRLAEFSQRIESLGSRVRQHRPDQVLALHRQRICGIAGALAERFQQRLRRAKDRLVRADDMLRLLSPEHTVGRGYTITTTADGKVIRSVSDVSSGTELRTRLRDGALSSVVSGSTSEGPASEKKRKPRKA
jgi:exodeoxyribonuclease VII large subunit